MNKKIFLATISFLLILITNAQKLTVAVNYVDVSEYENKNDIPYRPNQLLNWNDFKGKPEASSNAAALTNAGFGIKLSFRRAENASQLDIAVNCSFSRKDSWVKLANKTNYILNHEQKHFDIAYINTLLFIKNLRNANFTNTNYNAVIQKIYTETALAMANMQNKYDGETSHSRLPEKQAAWDETINQLLAATNTEFNSSKTK